MQETRKLRTILFADIAGYTALMQKDEQQALHQLNLFKEILMALVPNYQGKIIQYFGDGCLLTFESATQGVQCAAALQHAFGEQEIPVRMGMHLGEVLLRNNNAFGDGVNLASRIESMGVPGAVLVSKTVRNQLQNKAEFSLHSLGSFHFKNVAEPIEVFALGNAGLVVPKRVELKGKGKQTQASKRNWPALIGALVATVILILASSYFLTGWGGTEKWAENELGIAHTIAVFPFDVKGSPDIQYLGEGIVDLISTQLNEIPRLNSIDPNELFSKLKKGDAISRQPKEAADLASALGATKFILGSIVQIGEELQFSATKYNALGKAIVRQSVKGPQTEGIANTINELIKKLVADEMEATGYELGSLGAATSNNLESLKFYLQGEQANREMNYGKANELFTQAVEIDSTFALAWMRMTGMIGGFGFDDYAKQKWAQYKHTMPYKWQLYYEAIELARKADPRAIPAFKKLIQQYGNTPVFLRDLAEFYFHLNESYGGSPTEAKPYLLKTIELDPGNLEALFHLGNIALMENDMDELQRLKSMSNERNLGLLMMELILKDTVTDAEIEQALAGYSGITFFPELYFANEEKPFHNALLSRCIQLRPSPEGERLANVTKFCSTGREKEGFVASQECGKIGNIMGFSLEQIHRCLPATMMAVEDFSPFSEHYESLYQETKDRDTPWETYAAIKYALALDKNKEVLALQKKLLSLAISPKTNRMVKYYDFSIQAFEARRAGDNDQALAYIDSSYHSSFGFWDMQGAGYWDKTLLAANIYAGQGQYEKAISYFDHRYVMLMGGDMMMGYRNYKLSQWYEAIGDTEHALTRCNILLESYKNCDEKYQPWVEDVKERKARLMALAG